MIDIHIRIPKDLHKLLLAWAKAQDRSLNSAIVALLRRALGQQE